MNKPIRTTLIFGLLSALSVIPLTSVPVYWGWSISCKLFWWTNLTLYSVLLCRWSRTRPVAILFPLLLLLGMAIWPYSHNGFILIALAVFSWIRSGICFNTVPLRAVIAEIVTLAGGVGFVLFWWPDSSLALSLAIWLFFLVQTLYFYIIPTAAANDPTSVSSDAFEQARREMERLLETNTAA